MPPFLLSAWVYVVLSIPLTTLFAQIRFKNSPARVPLTFIFAKLDSSNKPALFLVAWCSSATAGLQYFPTHQPNQLVDGLNLRSQIVRHGAAVLLQALQ